MSDVSALRKVCAEAAQCGGDVLRAHCGRPLNIGFKGRSDIVTDADEASEAAVLGYLRPRFPEAAILAEETGASGRDSAALRFYVDPLDGTTNYATGLPLFTVNVAVADAGGMAAAATYDPVRDELFLSARGLGVTLNGAPVEISRCSDLGHSLLCTGFPYDVHERCDEFLRDFGAFLVRARAVRRLGSAALDLAYVACGRADGFWEYDLKPWDLAAGILHVREAGGIATDCAGGDEILESGSLCAAPPGLHPAMLEVLKLARRVEP